MMKFRLVNAAIIKLLGDAAADRFRVVGYAQQGRDASEIKDNKRVVQSYYAAGDFSGRTGRPHGSTQHAMTFTIGLSVSAAARVNLSVLGNENATKGQIAAAMDALQDAAYLADMLLDEMAELVYQILMDGRNYNIGFPKGTVANQWVSQIRKDQPQPSGELVVLTGALTYECSTDETVTGDPGTLATAGVGTALDVAGDDVERTGAGAMTFNDGTLLAFEGDTE